MYIDIYVYIYIYTHTHTYIHAVQEYHNATGPYLVVTPKSTLNNWMKEFNKWLPSCRVVLLQGNATERNSILKQQLVPGKFDVLLTSYEMCLKEKVCEFALCVCVRVCLVYQNHLKHSWCLGSVMYRLQAMRCA